MVGSVAGMWFTKNRSLAAYERRRVIVNTEDRTVYAGVLECVLRNDRGDVDGIVLRCTEVSTSDDDPRTADGEVVLLGGKISMLQFD